MHQKLKTLIIYELGLFKFDKWLLASISIIPLIITLLIGGIFQKDVVRDLPIAVVDLDNSSVSRQLTRDLDASAGLRVITGFASIQAAAHAMRDNRIYGVVEIPYEFSKKLVRFQTPSINAFYNTQFVLVGRSINSVLAQVVGTFNIKAGVARTLSKGNVVIKQAVGERLGMRQQISALYNLGANYGQFLVTAILPCAWQILIVAITILSLAAQHRFSGLKYWFKTHGWPAVIVKLFFYQAIFFIMGLLTLWYCFIFRQWPMHGSYLILIATQYLMVVASQALGCFLYFATLDPSRALSLTAVITAPSLAFIGVTFPATDMELFPRIWRQFLPVTHYMRVQIMQANYAASFFDTIYEWLPLISFASLFLVVWKLVEILNNKDKFER